MATPQLDHIVILLHYKDILSPPKWITDHFSVSPGGRHGDNKTENKLIVFQDGSYIELIAFIDDLPEHQEGHWWNPRDKGYGIVDYAFTLREGATAFEKLSETVQRLDIPAAWKPQPLRGGSRRKLDGTVIEWHVAFPHAQARGRAPFWCFDVTPRERRVPVDPALTTHPNGAKGVRGLDILTDDIASHDGHLQRLFDAILRQPAADDGNSWALSTPKEIESALSCQLRIVQVEQLREAEELKSGRPLVARLLLRTDRDEVLMDIPARTSL